MDPEVRTRELRLDDVDGVLAIYGDEATTRHLSFAAKTREEVDALVRGAVAGGDSPGRSVHHLVAEVDGTLMGIGRLDDGNPLGLPGPGTPAATLGLAVRSDVVRRGLGRRLVHDLCQLAWRREDRTHVWAAADPANTASAGLLLACGFTHLGRVEEHWVRHGVLRPSEVFLLLRP